MSKGIVDLRTFVGSLMAAVSTSAVAATAAKADHHGDACKAITAEMQQAMSQDDAINALKEGNARFVAGESVNCDYMSQVKATADGQYPIAAIVGCIDSRVPPELVFDQQIGYIFSARVAGNFVNEDILGSMEFGCHVAGAKLIMVIGHTHCGAVQAAIDDVQLGNITPMLAKIRPAIEQGRPFDGKATSENPAYVAHVCRENVRLAVAAIRERSEILAKMEADGAIKIVGAYYDLGSGEVSLVP